MSRTSSVTELIGRLVTLPRARLVAFGFLVVATLILAVSFATAKDRRTVFGPALGADYASFYVAGTILNRDGAHRLYDLEFQSKLYHELVPSASPDEILPYPYAPFLAGLLRPLAALRFEWSYLVWLLLNMAAYLAGIALVCNSAAALKDEDLRNVLPIAAAFAPFLFEGWIGGQSVGLLVLSVALAIRWQAQGRELSGGFALAFCLLKPTMLVLILPMLVVTRQAKMLAGFFLGALAALGLSLAAVGWQGCRGYVDLMMSYARVKDIAPDMLKTWKYVDLRSFLRMLLPGHGVWVSWIAIAVSAAVGVLLIRAWWKVRGEWSAQHSLAWAYTLSWTPVLTLQCGVYDASLIVPGVLLSIAVLKRSSVATGSSPIPPAFLALTAMLYVVPWFSERIALAVGLQLFTLAIAAMGFYQLRLAAPPSIPS